MSPSSSGARSVAALTALLLALLSGTARADQPLPSPEAYALQQVMRGAWLAWTRGQVDRAEAAAREASSRWPDAVEPTKLLCGLLVDSRRWTEADAPCERLRSAASEDPEALLLHARVALELGRGGAAMASAEAASQLAPEDPAGPLAEALIAARLLGDYPRSERALREASRRAPERSLAALPTRPGWEPLADDERFIDLLQRVLRDAENARAPAP